MSLPIDELGGLSESEINLRILQAKVDMGEMLDEKLGQVTSTVSSRMDAHETVVNGRLDRQDESIAKVLEIVTRVDAKGDDWHKADLLYRTSMESRVGKIEELLKLLRLYVLATRAFKIAKTSVSYVIKEGRQLGIWIAVCAVHGLLLFNSFTRCILTTFTHSYYITIF